MKAIQLQAPGGLDKFRLVELDAPKPGPNEILVRLRASSLNFHDYAVAIGMIKAKDGRIPMSDGAGEVVEVGSDVREFKAGDHVVSTFFPNWLTGGPTPAATSVVPGDSSDGYARELVVAPATSFTKAPARYSFEEAATLTCAGVTAWRGLVVEGRVKPGDWVLVQGTGGVSIFALQLAKAAGARVIATSSSDQKLEKLKSLGADHLINYRQTPEWGRKAKELTGGRGVDQVIEIGGPGTIGQSIQASRMGGHIALIGVLTGMSGEVPTAALFSMQITVSGIAVGSREHQQDLVRAVEASQIKPVIDKSFALGEIGDAFRFQESQKHFGKICLSF